MSTEEGRPVRPSARTTAAKAAAKLERETMRLSIETTPEVMRELRIRAAESDMKIRVFVLQALADKGVLSALEDIER